MESVVEVRDLFWRYPSFVGIENPWVIRGISLSVQKGEVFGITGPSGAGKTTLCRLILGVLPHGTKIPFRQVNRHIRGSVQVLGETVTRIDDQANVFNGVALGKLEGRGILSPRIGMVMQDPENQFLQMSLLHELAFGLSLQNIPPEEIRERSYQALQSVGLGSLWPDAGIIHPLDLSGGQKQRVAIASFLSLHPEVLILDEPTSDLDPQGKYEVIQAVRTLKEDHGMTILLIEQDPELLYEFCDRIALMDQGQIVSLADARRFFNQTQLLDRHGVASFEITRIAQASGIGEEGNRPVTIAEMLPHLKVNPSLSPSPPADVPVNREAAIQVEGIHFRYSDGTEGLQGANLTVYRGEIVALLGINGSGKTTLAKILAGIYPPGPGVAEVFGRSLADRRTRRHLPEKVGYVFQNPDHQLFTRRVYDEVAYGLRNLGVPADQRDAIIRRTLAMVGLTDVIDEDPLFLGKGQRQRLAVAAVLAMGPELLIVDEPTTGQDFRMISGIMALLDELHRQQKTILIISHDMGLVANHCSRAVVLLNGRTVFDGSPRRLFADPEILEQTHLRSTQSVRLSLEMRKTQPGFPILLNVPEWVNALSRTAVVEKR